MRNTKEMPLFHKAIVESGGATARACYTPTNPMHEQQFLEFLTLLGLQDVPETEITSQLRALSADAIKDASESIYWKYNAEVRWPWQPVIDGPGGMIPVRPIGKFISTITDTLCAIESLRLNQQVFPQQFICPINNLCSTHVQSLLSIQL